jgi:predicted acylesterase/phospholipase RssA
MPKEKRSHHHAHHPRESIERMVFVGGGAKGVVYPGAYDAMVRTGAFEDVKEISGASVGSSTAALVAFGMSPDALMRFLQMDFSMLMGERVGSLFRRNTSGVRFITKDGSGILNAIRAGIIETIQAYFFEMDDLELFLSQHPEIGELWTRIKSMRCPKITFQDLALLNQLDPGKFKRLTVVGTVYPTGELQIFNAEQTPEIEIALACRASSSLPVFLEPVSMVIGTEMKKIVDGGVYDNVPTDYFDVSHSTGTYTRNKKKTRTLVFMLDAVSNESKSPLFHALHSQSPDPYQMKYREHFEYTFGLKRVAGMKPLYCPAEQKKESYKRLQKKYALQTVNLRAAPVDTMAFDLAARLMRVMTVFGYLDTVNYLINHDLHRDCLSTVEFNAESFHLEMVGTFCEIYAAVRLGSGRSLKDDYLWNKLSQPNMTLLDRYYLIRNVAGYNVKSAATFALTRAVEFANNKITSETLFKETYRESFKRSSFFSISKITGQCVFKTSTLTNQLKNQNMFSLFAKRVQEHRSKTRTDEIFGALNKLDKFNHDYISYQESSVPDNKSLN